MTQPHPAPFQPTPIYRARRRRTLVRVQIDNSAGAQIEAIVEDISASGIRAIARTGPPGQGEMVTLHLPDGRALWGLVRWVDGRAFGVECDTSAEPAPNPPPRLR